MIIEEISNTSFLFLKYVDAPNYYTLYLGILMHYA